MHRPHAPHESGLVSPPYREIPTMSGAAAVLGFLPAFMDLRTQETHLSVQEDGQLATTHLLNALPDHWVVERDAEGRITALKDGIVAGFMRLGRFYSRSELAHLPWDS